MNQSTMDENNNRYSLTELQKLIRKTMEEQLSGFYWVSAEIAELKINYSGHCYLELIEKDKHEDIKSRIRAVIWSQKARLLLPYFKSVTGQELGEGIKVLLRGSIDYHEVYGLSLKIIDIDPAYTVGELALKRKEILERLENEGVINLNKELSFPDLPKRIAIISSQQAAGLQDFIDQLENNEYGYTYSIKLFSAVMQGAATEKSIVSSINGIFEEIDQYDLIVIARGGGSQSDLSWFDNYNIAYLISQSPVPVLTGIGHEKDLSVVDMVAHRSFKTPTAVADFIIISTAKTEEYLSRLRDSIIKGSREMVREKRVKINRIGLNMAPLVRSALQNKKVLINRSGLRLSGNIQSYLAQRYTRLESSGSELRKVIIKDLQNRKRRVMDLKEGINPALSRFRQQKQSVLDNFSRSIDYLSPERVLQRGYSITLFNGKSVKSPEELAIGSEIETVLKKGKIGSRVFDLKKTDK